MSVELIAVLIVAVGVVFYAALMAQLVRMEHKAWKDGVEPGFDAILTVFIFGTIYTLMILGCVFLSLVVLAGVWHGMHGV